eukprot:GFUD01042323.1.p1 GENE.GFUD01042323.1~~GFUD01042323.1.p1  ORF type:complete len:391 (+),score=122.86 GFUD01042323.1:133-1305(+)
MTLPASSTSQPAEYSAVAQEDTQQGEHDPPPAYEDPPQVFTQVVAEDSRNRRPAQASRAMPDLESCLNPTRGNVICKLVSAGIVVGVAIVIACMVDSYHKINEGYVGIYFRHGALRDKVTEPGVHFLMPFIEDYKEVRIRPETFSMDPLVAITKDGIENTFREITAITTIRKDKLVFMAKKFGMEFKKALVFDRIKEDLRIFCANHTIDEVYNTMFLDIVANVRENVKSSISRLGEDGIEILNLVIPKPEIPLDIAHNYKQVKVQWTEQLVATQQQKTERIKKETELIKAVADAERQKAVLEITIQERIIEKEGAKNVSLINNEIKKAAENNEADIAKYKLEKEAEANNALYTDKYIQLNLAKSLSNNTKFYFSGQQSELGSLFNKILGN